MLQNCAFEETEGKRDVDFNYYLVTCNCYQSIQNELSALHVFFSCESDVLITRFGCGGRKRGGEGHAKSRCLEGGLMI